ncbi:autotransporter domain-containing protein [Variovorax guangxiensis]|uniref:autotransporter domain-containing protein n=1 Tax=Variovorax guangxiensis TaxID=1775474 RepID=UPI001F4FE58A|nr:autotransporter domain-containing protein [Variovorax guangxiensis]
MTTTINGDSGVYTESTQNENNYTGYDGGDGSMALTVGGGLRVEEGAAVNGGSGAQGSQTSQYNTVAAQTDLNLIGSRGGAGAIGAQITSGPVVNAGSITGGRGGDSGTVSVDSGFNPIPSENPGGPVLTNLTGGSAGAGATALSTASSGTITNSGSISGGAGGGGGYVQQYNYGYYGNQQSAQSLTGQPAAGGEGGTGVLATQAATLNNSGVVQGGTGGYGGGMFVDNYGGQNGAIAGTAAPGGAGGAGAVFAVGGTLSNTNAIRGGDAGSASSVNLYSYQYNNEVDSSTSSTVTATGTTTGAKGGVGAYFGGVANVENSGSIIGGAGSGAGNGGNDLMALDASGPGSTAYISTYNGTSAGTLTATATGSVGGRGGDAIVMREGGQLTNTGNGWIQGGAGGAGGSAQASIYVNYNESELSLSAPITYVSAVGGDGGRGGDAIALSGGIIVNGARIQGGNGGNGGNASATVSTYASPARALEPSQEEIGGKGGAGGIAIVATGSTILNFDSGAIIGGDGGKNGGMPEIYTRGVGPSVDANAGGVAISGSDLFIVNAGTISGGFSGDGLTQADAVVFTGGVNTLALHATSKISGNVTAFGGNDTLALGGNSVGESAGVFNVATIGNDAQYRGFGVFRKVDEGTWALEGATAAVTPWTIDQGTLSIAKDASLGDVSGALTIGAGTLRTTDDITTARQVVLTAPTSTISNVINTTLTLNGTVSGAGTLVKEDAGTVRLGAANSYSGGTDIRAGYVATQVNGALGTGPVSVKAGGMLILDGSFNAGNLAISTAPRPVPEANVNSGTVQFKDQSSAGNATLQNQGSLEFRDNATAGTSSIRNDGGSTVFWESTTAGNATITAANKGSTNFWYDSSAGSAKLVNEAGGSTEFWDNSTGDNATVVNGAGGTLSISALERAGTSIGSIEGEGRILLGKKALTTGGLGTSTTIAGVISGKNGSLTKVGDGTLTLAAANTYTGGTTVSAGTLQLGNGGTSGSIVGDVVNNGTLAFNRSDAVSFAGAISGSGAVQQRGAGTTTLTADNTYTGGTTIAAGTLQVGNGGTTGSIAGNVVNNANLAINRSDAVTVPGSISGSGAVQQIGAGTTTLTGTNTYTGGTTIAAGTLVGGTSSFGSGAIANNGALVIDQPTDATFGNTLSGDGSLTKTGDATVFYTGDGTAFTGALQVKSGTLSVKSALNATVTVEPGSVLKGNGSVGNTFVSNGATVAPGNSIGTLTVNGNLTFAPGAFYEVETNAQGQSDRINVTGTATLGGASVVVIAADGNWAPTTRYTILTSGNRVGTFGGVSSNFAFLDPSITYEANNVLLTLNRNTVAFPTVGQTFNQRSTGAALEALGGGALFNAVVQLDAPTARSAFDQLSGELHASVRSSLMEDSRFVREAGIDRLRQAQGAATDLKTVEGMDGGAWARVYGSWGRMDGDGNAAKVDRDTSGVLVGADRRVGTWRVGVMGGAGRSDVDVDARRSSAKIDNYHLGVYGGTEWGALALRTGASYSRHEIDTNRSVGFTGVADGTKGSYDARTAQVFGELGWRIDAGRFALEPFANLAYADLKTDGFTEQGGITALRGRGESTDTTFTTLGLRASTRLGADATGATLRGLLGWRHAFGDVSQSATMAFAGGNGFAVAGVPIAKDAAVIEAGLDFAIKRDLTLGVSYAGQVGDGVKDHGVKASLLWKF